ILRRERQPHVVIALVLVEPVLTALIERHRLALPRLPGLIRLALATLLERGERLVAEARRIGDRRGSQRPRHVSRDVLRARQHGDALVLTPDFILAAIRGGS